MGSLDAATVKNLVERVGILGPIAIVAFMTVAVVASPIPSAPIALPAGAAYGHYAGAALVAIGSEIGAMLAFVIARYLGWDALGLLLKGKEDYGLLGSQNALTLIVFVSRLLPFVSFDAMSYAASLSKIHFWRFLLATLAGILPASFLLAHFGATAISGEFGAGEYLIFGLSLLTAVPLLLAALRRGRGR